MSAVGLPDALKSITATKFEELRKQRDSYEKTKAAIYANASAADNAVAAAQSLLDGTKALKNIHLIDDVSDDDNEYVSYNALADELHNKSQLLRQAAVDPSLHKSLVSDIHESLKRDLELESIRRQHAHLCSALVSEWLSNPDDSATSGSTNFEEVGRKEMHEQKAMWESLVFNKRIIDTSQVNQYLNDLFNNDKATSLAQEKIVKDVKNYGSTFWDTKEVFNEQNLKQTIQGLLDSDLFSKEKSAILKMFASNSEVLKEVADVLNMRFASLSNWNWTLSGKSIPVEMRRQLNGKYRVFMEEDILDAILLHAIGLKWSVFFKSTFTKFFHSFAWKRTDRVISAKDRERRGYFLKKPAQKPESINQIRRSTYSEDYFLTQLPTNEAAGKRNYDEDNDDEAQSPGKGPLELKHGLLHLLVAESLIAQELHPNATHTIVRSDFKWFGPALPHDTIFAVLKFFGVDNRWIEFFNKFLRAPLSFIHDGPNAKVQTRACGIPLSHTISDMMGEVVLFVMDFAVNRATSSYLYRLHDDFWLWGSEKTCLQGWQAMTKFSATMGIEFNQEKTGTVRIGQSDSPQSFGLDDIDHDDNDSAYSLETTSLPQGEVRWGFLKLDAAAGRFLVDQSQVDCHITELRTQLSYCRSVFSYIQSYNAYAGRFFTNNFGKPSYGFGRDHVDMMIETFRRIQQSLFPGGSVTDHLASMVLQRFGIKDLPPGVWYFPVELGGLALINPLISLLGMRSSFRTSRLRLLQKAQDAEQAAYYQAQRVFKDNDDAVAAGFGKYKPDLAREINARGESFMTKEEYSRYPEETSSIFASVYSKFLEVPEYEEMKSTPDLVAILSACKPSLPYQGRGILASFEAMDQYWKWIVALHGKDIAAHYGSVRMVDVGQVPTGVFNLMKKGRVRWKG